MTKQAQVVIGANFGDEGKGLVTDFLASQIGPDALVVRYNGGAQAGHTVTTPDGRRHVFGHFGSGSFVGCPTFLSRFFVCNPLTFLKEAAVLGGLGVAPVVYVDPDALITTPYDMMINQCLEETRGMDRHGSCGLGFGETIERSLWPEYRLTYRDLKDQDFCRKRLRIIHDQWMPARLGALGQDTLVEPWCRLLNAPQILENFLVDLDQFRCSTRPSSSNFLSHTEHIIFEGAQGLLLDQTYGWFPHVTRSYTGLRNVVALAQESGIDDLAIHYLTRCYLTRHGAGPMPHECPHAPYANIKDETNIPNPYQGALRFGLLDLDLLGEALRRDLAQLPDEIKGEVTLVVSCMDQAETLHRFVSDGCEQGLLSEAFLQVVAEKTEAAYLVTSHGPTREDVVGRYAMPLIDRRGALVTLWG